MVTGVFAGRGDVILALGLALMFGLLIGWKAKGGKERITAWLKGTWLGRLFKKGS